MYVDESPISAPVASACKSCGTGVTETISFCHNCGFPLQGSQEEQDQFIYERGYRQLEINEMEGKIRSASTTIFILAGVFALFGFVYYMMLDEIDNPGAVLVVNLVLAGLYVLLGFWTKSQPVAAIVSALVLFVVVQLLNVFDDWTNIFKGIIFKIIIIVALVKGLRSAFEAQRIRKLYNQ